MAAGNSGGHDDNCSRNNWLHAPPPHAIPFELIAEILVRLPVKSLVRFRCVCKSWDALISDPKFAKAQLRASGMGLSPTLSARHHLIVTQLYDASLRDYSLRSAFDASGATRSSRRRCPHGEEERFRSLVGSCHGMLCVAIGRSGPILWNPSTGKLKILPSLENRWQEPGFIIYGFGYDHFSDSYKVVAICTSRSDADVMVHTVGTDSWRATRVFPPSLPLDNNSAKFVSGTLNWLAKDMASSSRVIVSLDLGTETYQQLLPPVGGVLGGAVTLTLGVLKDCLCILAHHGMISVSDVWVMKDYGNRESWTTLFGVGCHLGGCPGLRTYYYEGLFISDDDDEILLVYGTDLVVYNCKRGTFRTHVLQDFRSVGVYVESLILTLLLMLGCCAMSAVTCGVLEESACYTFICSHLC